MIAYLYLLAGISILVGGVGYFVARPLAYRNATVKCVEYKRPSYIDVCAYLAPISICLIIYKTFMTDYLSIPSESMLPTLPVGSMVKVDKNAYGLRSPLSNEPVTQGSIPLRGEMVVTQFPLNKQVNYIKRVVGLPGDVISITPEGIYINKYLSPFIEQGEADLIIKGEKVPHTVYNIDFYGIKWNVAINPAEEFPAITDYKVPKDAYFLLGDNLTASSDSRSFGAIPYAMLIGSAT